MRRDRAGVARAVRGARALFVGLLASLLVSLLGGCAANPEGDAADGPPRPNLLLVLVDDAGWVDLGFQGSREFATPALDAFRDQGVQCTQAYVAASVCSPSRAALLTGRHPQRFGHEFNIPGKPLPGTTWEETGLPVEERTLADRLGAAGYRTGAIGKWHLGETAGFRPLERGFEEFFGFLGGSRSYWALDGDARRGHLLREGDDVVAEIEGTYLTEVLADRTLAFLDAHVERGEERPFFLYLSWNAVHTPMHATERDLEANAHVEPAKRRKLGGMTTALDAAMARILTRLDELGMAEDTLVLFLNDNGGATINASSNGPLRGHKGTKFEGGLRVPWVVRWPRALPEGGAYGRPVSALDVVPTFLSAAGVPVPPEIDGVDLLPYLTGAADGDPHERMFWRRGVVAAVRAGDWKLIRAAGEPVALFDLARDPFEHEDRRAEEPGRVTALMDALAEWERGLTDPRWRTAQVWTERQLEWHTSPDERASATEGSTR